MGMLDGYPDGSFKPEQFLKRSELITVINRYFGLKEKEESNFEDVSNKEWYMQMKLQKLNIMDT